MRPAGMKRSNLPCSPERVNSRHSKRRKILWSIVHSKLYLLHLFVYNGASTRLESTRLCLVGRPSSTTASSTLLCAVSIIMIRPALRKSIVLVQGRIMLAFILVRYEVEICIASYRRLCCSLLYKQRFFFYLRHSAEHRN